MKVAIKQKVLANALEKGSVAALTNEAQTDTSNMSLLVQAVKITANAKKLTFESCTNLIGVKHVLSVSKEDGVLVQDDGCAFVAANELSRWVKAQGEDATINITLSELSSPEFLNAVNDDDIDDSLAIKKTGVLKLVSKDKTKSGGNKWELDSYDPSQREMVGFGKKDKGIKCFEVPSKPLESILKIVKIASIDNDPDHIYDSVSIQIYKDNVYFSTTDTKRCALYKMSTATDIQSDDTLLVPLNLLETASKISDKNENVVIYYNEAINRVFVEQKNLDIRVVCVEKDKTSKFPSIGKLIDKKYGPFADISKSVFKGMLTTASIVNSKMALFTLKSDKDIMVVKAISENGKYRPNVSSYGVNKRGQNDDDISKVWSVSHLKEVTDVVKNDNIKLLIPSDERSLKIVDEDNEDFSYFAMAINNSSLYN